MEMASSVIKKEALIFLLMQVMVERMVKICISGQRTLTILTNNFEKFRKAVEITSCKSVML